MEYFNWTELNLTGLKRPVWVIVLEAGFSTFEEISANGFIKLKYFDELIDAW